MPLKLYNTLRREKETFEPLQAGKVKMYVCGVTVYDKCHIGHARANVTFDVIFRYLKYLKYEVEYVRNFTDVDDKIIKRSNELKITWQELTERYIREFSEDMKVLGNETPTREPKATEHMPQMISIIEKLISKNLAYAVESGDVFYRVRNFKEYGKLSQKNIEDLESGARVEVLESKTDPLDFALWKSAKPGEPSWSSPWGNGRPGWHIECSAMSMQYLGESFDIHGGGRDLIFPHHENEIAQSEGATEKSFVKYWMHNGFVNINAEKMSKSLGNFFTIQDSMKHHAPEGVRAFLLSVHNRSPNDFTDQNLKDTSQSLERYYTTIKRVKEFLKSNCPPLPDPLPQGEREILEKAESLLSSFQEAMDDDFNTAMVQGQIFEMVRAVNKLLDEHERAPSLELISLFTKLFADLEKIHSVLGCYGTNSEDFFERQRKLISQTSGVDEAKILALIEERKQARLSKNFKRADEVRQELAQMNVVLKDRPDGTTEWSLST